MIISKIRGTHRHIPIGKIRLAYLYETLRYTCSIHPLFEEDWTTLYTSDLPVCLNFVIQNVNISFSPSCLELGYFIKALMAILNHPSHTLVLKNNQSTFMEILSGFQSNPNVATVSKCSIYKIPFCSPRFVKSKYTTYYLLFNFVPLLQSQRFFNNILDNCDNYGKRTKGL